MWVFLSFGFLCTKYHKMPTIHFGFCFLLLYLLKAKNSTYLQKAISVEVHSACKSVLIFLKKSLCERLVFHESMLADENSVILLRFLTLQ